MYKCNNYNFIFQNNDYLSKFVHLYVNLLFIDRVYSDNPNNQKFFFELEYLKFVSNMYCIDIYLNKNII